MYKQKNDTENGKEAIGTVPPQRHHPDQVSQVGGFGHSGDVVEILVMVSNAMVVVICWRDRPRGW